MFFTNGTEFGLISISSFTRWFKRKNHDNGIGNIKCLEEWCEFLPANPINVDQPWFYSMDHALSFPIFYKHSQTRAEHRYSFKRKVTDLLRVQILDQGKWKDIVRNTHVYLDISSNSTIKTPELWGRYAYISENEIGWFKCTEKRSYYFRSIEMCDTENPNRYKTTAEITLHCNNPCLAFFWVAENRNATLIHNFSNYTTNANDIKAGYDPIKTTSLTYGTTKRLDKMPSDHFSIAEPRKHFPSAPNEKGYHGHSYAWDSTSFHGDIGIVFAANMNVKLHCKIDEGNIYKNGTGEDEKDAIEDIDDDREDVDPRDDSDDDTNLPSQKLE